MSQRSRSREKTRRLFMRVAKKCLRRHEEMTVSEWAEKYRVLDNASSVPGRWSNSITPYLCEIMDSFNDPDVRKLFLCKAAQLGGTAAMINILCYIITQSQGPTMIVYPKDDLAKDISNDKLKPAFQLVPEVRELFLEEKSKELNLKFREMAIYLRSANSPADLASKEAQYLFFDEIDKMGGASKKEASPYDLALERTKTYRERAKVFAISTPTIRTNYIWRLCEGADEVRHYFVKCPHCGEYIELKWKQVIYAEDPEGEMSNHERAATAIYVCQECGCGITDREKMKALREGKWMAVKKRGKGKAHTVGYWINSLYSAFVKWADAAEKFLDSKDDPELLQNFINSWLAEPWEDTKLKTSADLVMERQTETPGLTVPNWAKLLTGGVDVQENCIYWTIRAWGDGITSQNIAHGQELSLKAAEEIMNLEYQREDGEAMIVSLALIDSGYDSDSVYDFCADNSDWALPVKGASNPQQNHFKISKVDKVDSKAYGMRLVIIDGGKYKDMIANRMRKENGRGSWMVYAGCDREYAEQVTSEHKVIVRSGRKAVLKWEPKKSHADNHYLDAEVYAFAAADMQHVRTMHLQAQNSAPAGQEPQEEESWIAENENWI